MLPLLATLTVCATVFQLTAQDPQRPPQGGPGQGGPGQKGPGQKGGPGGPGGGNFGGGGGGGGEGFRPPQHPLEIALDANGDGVIDAKELANAVAALKKLDRNGDGRLTEDEYRPVRPQGGGQGGQGGQGGFGGQRGGPGQGGGPGGPGGPGGEPRRPEGQPGAGGGPAEKPGGDSDFVTRLFQNDKNKDGKITKDELPEAMQSLFELMDTNRDSAIDRKEAEAFAERMKQRGGGSTPGTAGKRPPLEK